MTDYRSYGLTVWFEKMPENNPFEIVSEYGEARTIGRGNSFDEADIYREALEAIMEVRGYGKEYEIAEAALEKVSEALVAGLKFKAATDQYQKATELYETISAEEEKE